MKFGIRKPSIKKSISARTTGKVKRKLKRLTNPFYGKKGVGLITNPKKSVYNKVYRKTSVSAKGAMGCLTACIFYPIYFMCLLTWWFIKYSALFLWWTGIFLINGIISIVEFFMNMGAEDSPAIDGSEDAPPALQAHNGIDVECAPEVPAEIISGPHAKGDEIKSLDYFTALRNEIKPLENEIVGYAKSLNETRLIDSRIALLTSQIDTFYALKSKCEALGPEYAEYFSKQWEHCHNSRNADFNYIAGAEEELKDLQNRYSELKEQEDLYKKEVENLRERVITVLTDNPGILQTDVYKHFNPLVKGDVSKILADLSKDNTIERVKSGRTYSITILK